MRLYGNLVALLDGSGDGNGTRTAANSATFEASIGQLAVNVLGVVGGDVDESRLQCSQFVDVGKELAGTRALQWWQHLERELSLALVLVDEFCNAHIECKSNTFSGVLTVYGVKGS